MEKPHSPDSISEPEQSDIRELGLSNAEWMRYRMSWQLPERAEKGMQQRYHDQMAGAEQIAEEKRLKVEAGPVELKECSPDVLIEMLTDIKRLLADGGDTYTKILETAIKFDENLKPNYFTLSGDKEVWATIKNEVRDITTTVSAALKGLDQEKTAQLIEAAASLVDYVDTNEATIEMVTQCIEGKKYQVIGQLLEKKMTQDVAFYVFYDAKRNKYLYEQNRDEMEMGLPLLPSFVAFAEAKIERNGYEAAREVSRLIGSIIEYVKSNHAVIPELAKKIDLQKIADSYFSALNQKREEIAGGYPAHSTTAGFLETFMHIYKPSEHFRILPPSEMALFLKKIYQEKVIRYSIGGNPNPLHYSIESLCDMCNIDFQTVKG